MEENKETTNTTASESTTSENLSGNAEKKCPKCRKRLIKWGSIILIIVLVLLFLPGIIVSYIVPPVASQLLKTKVEIGSAFINVFDGAVRIRNMKVHNPEGYDSPYAFELKHFYVDVKMLTLASPKIEIADIIIEDMHATLEMKWGTNNLEQISSALKKPVDPKAEKKTGNEEEKKSSEPAKEPPKMVIRHFKISQSDFTMLKVPWPIPSVELTDIGDGRPITDFAVVVYDAVVEAVITASKNVAKGAGNIGKGIGKAATSIGESTKEAGEALNKAADDVSKSLKNIFKK